MKYLYFIIFSVIIIIGLKPAKAQFVFDKNYYLGRAINLAGLGADESIDRYEIKISNLWQAGEKELTLDPSEKIINITPLRFGVGSIQIKLIAPTFEIDDGANKIYFSSFKRGVQGVLKEAGIILAKDDRVEPALDQVPRDKKIKITRVIESELEEFETVPFQTKEILDANLERGKTLVEQAGSTGKKRLLYSVRRENGVEISKRLISSDMIEKPQNKIIHIGTKVVVLSSVSGLATATNLSNAVVSANYRRGTLVRITNLDNGKRIEKTVNYTWGIATPPDGVVLDLSWDILDQLGYNGGRGVNVLVEELKQ